MVLYFQLTNKPSPHSFPIVAISYRASSEIVRALLEAFPESAGLPNGVGMYPLHLLCDVGSCVDSLCAVLETAAGAATPKKLDALHILNMRMNRRLFQRAIQSMREARKRQQATRNVLLQRQRQQQQEQPVTADTTEASDHTNTRTSNEINAAAAFDRNERMISSFQQNDYWQKAALLVLVAYTQQPLTPQGLEDEQANVVHACAGVPDCPRCLLEFAILLHMDDLSQKKDSQGRLPLHVAAKTHARCLLTSKEGDRRKQLTRDALKRILNACPAAAFEQDADGNLPLALAVQELSDQSKKNNSTNPHPTNCRIGAIQTWSSGLQDLLDANLAALETLNLDEKLYPYVWAKRMTSVDKLLESVRQNPGWFCQGECRLHRTVGC
jgi:hypothetical protein